MKIGRYTEDEILEHLTEGEGRGFLGRSMYDAIFDKIHALITKNEQLEQERNNYKELYEKENKNWNELKEWLKEEKENRKYANDVERFTAYNSTLEKMQEIERL